MPADETGQIITFYSYKGGTGRTMALANVACLLAERTAGKGKRVLMVDWDLEAPGLHRFFRNQFVGQFGGHAAHTGEQLLDAAPGLLDLFWTLHDATLDYGPGESAQSEHDARRLLASVKPETYALPTDIPNLSLLKAGASAGYSTRVNTFRWESLYDRSPWLITAFAERLAEHFSYVLVDSRTGLTDVSGICTMLMPERLVVVFTPNRQSISGGLDLAERATHYRKQSGDLRPLVVFPLASRVEASRDQARTDWRYGSLERGVVGYQRQFEELFRKVYQLPECDLEEYFDEVQIQQSPDYAYGEVVAVRDERSEDRLSLTRSYKTFTERLVESPSPWQKARETEEFKRLGRQTVRFPSGGSAEMVRPPAGTPASEVLRALGLAKPNALILLLGMGSRDAVYYPLYSEVLARVAIREQALVIDSGGETSFVAGHMGEKLRDWGRRANLLGVVPNNPPYQPLLSGLVPSLWLEPNHTHFAVAEGTEWGDEVDLMLELAAHAGDGVPVVAVLAGGEEYLKRGLLRCVQQKWPILIMERAGGLAEEVAALRKEALRLAPVLARESSKVSARLRPVVEAQDSLLTEIINRGEISIVPSGASALDFERLVYERLTPGTELRQAWHEYAAFARGERTHSRRQRLYLTLLLASLSLAALILLLQAGSIQAPDLRIPALWQLPSLWPAALRERMNDYALLWNGLTAALLPGALWFWRLWRWHGRRIKPLRAAAEATLSEIVQYRTQTGAYGIQQTSPDARKTRLSDRLVAIQRGLLRRGILTMTRPGDRYGLTFDDTGFSSLSADDYVNHRVRAWASRHLTAWDWAAKWQKRLVALLISLSLLAVVFVSGGALLSAAFIAVLMLAVYAYVGGEQLDAQARLHWQKASVLRDINFWWNSLPAEQTNKRGFLERLVGETEAAIGADYADELWSREELPES